MMEESLEKDALKKGDARRGPIIVSTTRSRQQQHQQHGAVLPDTGSGVRRASGKEVELNGSGGHRRVELIQASGGTGGGQHVVKIRVNATTTSSNTTPAPQQQQQQQPVVVRHSPTTTTASSLKHLPPEEEKTAGPQSHTNAVRINIGTADSSMVVPSPYFFYSHPYRGHPSGQSSPSDSGTCSDLDAGTPPPMPKKKTVPSTSTTVTVVVSTNHHRVLLGGGGGGGDHQRDHQRGGSSLTSSGADAEESDDDVISCDSLNSSELDHQQTTSSSEEIHRRQKPTISDPPDLLLQTTLPVIIERTYDQRTSTLNNSLNALNNKNSCSSPTASPNDLNTKNSCSSPTPSSSIFDSFYKFHLNETGGDDVSAVVSSEGIASDSFESFAGCKGYYDEVGADTATIRSSKGTIRGVKNRVRAGIATFLQIHASKTWQEKEAGKVVVYTTTMGIVRETYSRCLKVKQILRTNLVKFDEKDLFMSQAFQAEIRERMSSDTVAIPQVFVEGQLIGDAEFIERLNESGELRRILKPYQSPDACTTCQVCGGYRLLPCAVCNGSKKSVHRNHFTTELVALKCMNCDEVGLVKCYAC